MPRYTYLYENRLLPTKWYAILFGWERKGYSCANEKFNLCESLEEAPEGTSIKDIKEIDQSR